MTRLVAAEPLGPPAEFLFCPHSIEENYLSSSVGHHQCTGRDPQVGLSGLLKQIHIVVCHQHMSDMICFMLSNYGTKWEHV